jgi:hypothetical protein
MRPHFEVTALFHLSAHEIRQEIDMERPSSSVVPTANLASALVFVIGAADVGYKSMHVVLSWKMLRIVGKKCSASSENRKSSPHQAIGTEESA